jgi:diguanylate cyclase (GGDEF)-like protein
VGRTSEQLRKLIWDLDIAHPRNLVAPRVTISVGWAVSEQDSWEELLRKADAGLYQAKKDGRNRVCDGSNLTLSR